MKDRETGTTWQQISGEGLLGPLKDEQLTFVFHEELSYGVWKKEHPHGRVLKIGPGGAEEHLASEDWEEVIGGYPATSTLPEKEDLKHRTLVLGLKVNETPKAYPFKELRAQKLIMDDIGQAPIFLILAEDGLSARAFHANIDGERLDFFLQTETENRQLVDSQTGSIWNFRGEAMEGPHLGRKLEKIWLSKEYWFDWKEYNPESTVFGMSLPEAE